MRIINFNFFSGWWLSASCPHGIVYALKFLLRAQSPRDYVDILFSMKVQPNIVILDIAPMVATSGNNWKPGMCNPNLGWLACPSGDNISLASSGRLIVDLPWLECPTKEHYCLFDTFREINTSKKSEILRRVKFVKIDCEHTCVWTVALFHCEKPLFSELHETELPEFPIAYW